MTSFPNNIWNGESSHRATPYINRKPDDVDWNRIVDELIATQSYIKYLETLISQGGGGGGGVLTVAGRAGNVTLSSTDISGLAPSATTDTTNASNISSGTLSNIRLPNIASGTSGQIQVNNNGSLLGLNGTAAISDTNGPTDAVAIGVSSWALGEQSVAIGNDCIASTDYSVAMGQQSFAGDPLHICTISGTVVTISGDVTNWFYNNDSGALVLSQLSGGTGSTIAYGSPTAVDLVGGNTVITLAAPVTAHTAGRANMRDNMTGATAFGGGRCYSSGGAAFGGTAGLLTDQVSYAFSLGLNIASGPNSLAAGGFTRATGNGSFSIGSGTHATANGAVASGINSVASGTASHTEGEFTIASGVGAHAEGISSIASGAATYAGGTGAIASLLCQWARSDGNLPGQVGHFVVSGNTAGATPVTLLIGGTDRLSINNNCIYAFIIDIVAYKTDGSKFACFLRRGLISNVNNVTTLVGSVLTIGTDINTTGWSVDITADATNNALAITVTGETTVNWRARVDFTEIGI